MKVYTRTGDDGTTGLVGGKRVSKADLRIEAYGTVDELNAWIGMLRDQVEESRIPFLIGIQENLFIIGSTLATESGAALNFSLPTLDESAVKELEEAMDTLDKDLEPLRYFVLPGGHPAVSTCHVARTVCRRAERQIINLNQHEEVPVMVLHYINRLSDYFFVLSRHLAHTFKIQETPWKPRKSS